MKTAALLNTFPLVLVLASFNAYSPTQCEIVRNSYQLMTVPLPEFLLSATLSRVVGKHLPNCLSQVLFSEPIVFDWSEVCFFDDYALLKLVLLQRGISTLLHGEIIYELPMLAGTRVAPF